MNSTDFRRELRKHTQYKSPEALYTAVLLATGNASDKWHVWSKSIHWIDRVLPAHIATQAHTRFILWWEFNNAKGNETGVG